MKLIRAFSLLSVLLYSLVMPAVAEEQAWTVIESISYHKDDGGQQETLSFKLNSMYLPKIFTLKGQNPRLVLDFLDTAISKKIDKVMETNSRLIKRIRVGLHTLPEPKTRVVIDMTSQLQFGYESDVNNQENIFILNIFESSDQKPNDAAVTLSTENRERLAPQPQVSSAKDEPDDSSVQPNKISPDYSFPPSDNVFGMPQPADTTVKEQKTVEAHKQPQANEPQLLDILFEDSSNKGEMVVFKLNGFYPPVVFGLEKATPRVVCDFTDTRLSREVPFFIDSNGVYVEKIRTAQHKNPDKIRVVLDLVPDKNYDLQQIFFKEDNYFVIIVNSFEEDFFVPGEKKTE